MNDDVIPLNEISKIGTVKVYNQAYVDKQQKRITELEKENAELKAQIEIKDIQIKELQEQKIYWKESSFDWRHNYFKLDKVKRLIKKDKQLTKAKKLLNEFNQVLKERHLYHNELYKRTEQFISEVEK